MFAVPGWSLGTPRTQESYPEKQSRKRKRENHAKAAQQVTNKNSRAHSKNFVQNPRDEDRRPKQMSGRERVSKSQETRTSFTRQSVNDENDRQEGPSASGRTQSHQAYGENRHARYQGTSASRNHGDILETIDAIPSAAKQTQVKLTPMQAAMRQKLVSARFRHLNQTLYTSPSAKAQALFESNPSFFDEYHAGFRLQVSNWPENPVDSYVHELKCRGKAKVSGKDQASCQHSSAHGKIHTVPLPRSHGVCTIADLGCGDGRIANQLQNLQAKFSLRILSFDLQSNNPFVTKADISNVPLEDGSVNVAILCLALMGTNWISFVEEAWRILHWKGELWIAEIKSRFGRETRRRVDHSVGKRRKIDRQRAVDDENDQHEQLQEDVDGSEGNKGTNDVSAFVKVLERRGFVLRADHGVDMTNQMFVKLRFSKAKASTKGKNVDGGTMDALESSPSKTSAGIKQRGEHVDEASVLKPCLYKKR